MMRWGGILTDYYRWREGVGPREKRVPFVNLLWGGIESSQVGTAEFVDFSRRVGADPLICVNFESDGRERFMKRRDSVRTADAAEAADWVAYCNQPDHAERKAHGFAEPLRVPVWKSEARIASQDLWYARSWFGISPADRLFMIWGHSHLLGNGMTGRINGLTRNWKDRLLGYQRWPAYVIGDAELRSAAEAMLRFRPGYVLGYSWALDRFARVNRERPGLASRGC